MIKLGKGEKLELGGLASFMTSFASANWLKFGKSETWGMVASILTILAFLVSTT